LIVSNAGIDTTQIASQAVIGREFQYNSGATGLYDENQGRIVNAINGFVKELGTDSDIFITFNVGVSRKPIAFKIFYNIGTSYTSSLSTNVTQASMVGTASIYEYFVNHYGSGGSGAGAVSSYTYRLGGSSALAAGTYNIAIHCRGSSSSDSQTREHTLIVQEIKK
jgi:hypothetical protein